MWNQSQALRITPSDVLGLTRGSYEAYCLDQAIWFFGSQVQSEVEKAGHKKQKGESQRESARKKVLDKYLDTPKTERQYADPAAFFQ